MSRRGAPAIIYPPELPVSERRQDIMAAIRDHQVVVVAGETGSGKTTQLPKMCLELGRGVDAMIGHTQPRRIAARTVAERLADELGVQLGDSVGYAVRFDDRVGADTMVKVMTDGLLLAEVRRDPDLRSYDTIIVDEAHERSLNIDFLLGYLTRLLPRRPDLKVIITSATIDTDRFAQHFGAPVVEVSGRTWPVEIRYRAPSGPESDEYDGDDDGPEPGPDPGPGQTRSDQDDADINRLICDAVAELAATGPGDVLVFLPGERDIRDAAEALQQSGPEGLDILPLYARLSTAEQHKVFKAHRGRRVVLATNVAETSLTVPGIRFVVDTGLARISRFNHRTKVQRLPIETISQASANQRAGRCGRLGPGVCIRLYSEDDFRGRPEFTDPEILRTNLASVLLQMAAAGLGPVEDFPFLEPPDRRSVADGRALLDELGAFRTDDGTRLSRIGYRLAELPVDPRLGRMVVEAERLDCLTEVVVVVAAMTIQDPRERPSDDMAAAAEFHRRFEAPDSDFMSLLRLWDYLAGLQSEMSGNRFRRQCRAEYLHVLRIREWQDLVGQIRQVLRSRRATFNRTPAAPEQIHQALLTGLLSHVGLRDRVKGDYYGARNTRWSIGRSSVLARRPPQWAMAGELVETNRTWARTVARIEPAWAERAGSHLLKRTWSDPWWDRRRGEAVVEERATLYGLPVVSPHTVGLHRTDPEAARSWFIDEALVARDWDADFPPHELTARREAMVVALEERVRRRDLLAGPDARRDWYDTQVPARITGGAALLKWWRRAGRAEPEVLAVPLSVLVDRSGGPVDLSAYPDSWRQGELQFGLSYRYEPGAEDDGVTVTIPLDQLNVVDTEQFEWHIDGFRPELVMALVRSLPKELRRALGPAPEVAASVLDAIGPPRGSFRPAVADQLARMAGTPVPPSVWAGIELPPHLRLRFVLRDGKGGRSRVVATGRDLGRLARTHRPEMLAALRRAFPGWDLTARTTWDFGDIPDVVRSEGRTAWPGLVEESGGTNDPRATVGMTLWDTAAARDAAMWPAVRRLLRLAAPLPGAHLERRISQAAKLALLHSDRRLDDLVADCTDAVLEQIVLAAGGPPRRQAAFEAMASEARSELAERVIRVVTIAGGVVAAAVSVLDAADRLEARYKGAVHARALADVRHQVDDLVAPGFVSRTGPGKLRDLLRYLDAAGRRIERLPTDVRRDAARQDVVDALRVRLDRLLDGMAAGADQGSAAEVAARARWMIEELRVSLWAQQLGTPAPVSEERISRLLAQAGV